MAGFTSTFHHPFKLHLSKPLRSLPFHPNLFTLHLRSPATRSPSISSTTTATTVIVSRYGGGGGSSGKPKSNDEQALDISSIRSDKVRLIDQQQNMVGIVSKGEALQMADNAELDLVILSPDSDPPVVRIMDYNKYRYELQKKKREQQKKSLENYSNRCTDFNGSQPHGFEGTQDGVKIIVNLKGRENDFRNNAIELIRRFQNDVGELAVEENKNFRDRNIFIILVPNKAVVQKAQEPPKKKDKSTANEVSAGV
ncbi:translation initiation factor if-3 [Olea europaea subsp. europaea]|uniref:Translation initiation factor if-3 n=1 Tax=Olea europaea subsp. europaea TaxID=158383 RepID=A0A8S0TQQ7_OLEEU|nr:translation initiation factor if-3 [Olea europaea subsp. europaea]